MKKNLDFISRTKDILIVFFQKCTIISPLIICILLCSITAKAKKETLTANYVRQQKSNWCWAASAENSVRYERKTKRTQKDAVKKIKGFFLNPYPNMQGYPIDIKNAAEYISFGTENYSCVKHQENFNFLKRQVHIKNVSIVTYGIYKGKGKIGGHAVAVIGYNDNMEEIQIYDPSSSGGGKKWFPYNAFQKGTLKLPSSQFKIKYQETIFNLDR